MITAHTADADSRQRGRCLGERRAREVLGLFAAVLLFPSANYQIFSGLPLSQPAEYAFAIALIPLFAHRKLRWMFGTALGAMHPRLARAMSLAAVAVLLMKCALFWTGDYRGLLACYHSEIQEVNGRACELSYENPLGRFGVTRIDRAIDFSPDRWNLTFLNSLRFNIDQSVRGNRVRERLPFSAQWTGTLSTSQVARKVSITYVGEGTVTIGKQSAQLPSSYARASTSELAVPPGGGGVDARLVQVR